VTEHQQTAQKQNSSKGANDAKAVCSVEEAKVWAALKKARQNVKPIIKKERNAETASAELLNLRLKAL